MKIAGALTLAAGLFVAAVLSLFPANVTVLGTDISCGLPIRGALFGYSADTEAEIAIECRRQSAIRLGIGAVGGLLVLGGGGLLMILLAPDPEEAERERRAEEHRRFMRWQWEQEQRRAWEARQPQQASPSQTPPPQPPPYRPPSA